MKKLICVAAIAICGANLVMAASTCSRAEVKNWIKEGQVRLASDQRAEAIMAYKNACNCNDASGCLAVGKIYAAANDGQNFARAAIYYNQACELKNAAACTSAGVLYQEGLGVHQDSLKAAKLHQKACKNGDSAGCYYLAEIYLDNKNYQLAEKFYDKACGKKYLQACSAHAMMYEDGDGVARDENIALKLRKKACSKGDGASCVNVGGYYKRLGQDAKAAGFYKQACEKNDANGCSNLGLLYDRGDGVKQDLLRAVRLYERACEGNSALGCSNLAATYLENANYEQAKQLYAKACALGDEDACVLK